MLAEFGLSMAELKTLNREPYQMARRIEWTGQAKSGHRSTEQPVAIQILKTLGR